MAGNPFLFILFLSYLVKFLFIDFGSVYKLIKILQVSVFSEFVAEVTYNYQLYRARQVVPFGHYSVQRDERKITGSIHAMQIKQNFVASIQRPFNISSIILNSFIKEKTLRYNFYSF